MRYATETTPRLMYVSGLFLTYSTAKKKTGMERGFSNENCTLPLAPLPPILPWPLTRGRGPAAITEKTRVDAAGRVSPSLAPAEVCGRLEMSANRSPALARIEEDLSIVADGVAGRRRLASTGCRFRRSDRSWPAEARLGVTAVLALAGPLITVNRTSVPR